MIIDNNPRQTFDNFEYSIVDESLDSLRNDIAILDESVHRELAIPVTKVSTAEQALQEVYQKFSDKLGIQVGYSNFKDVLNNISEENKIQRDLLEAVNAKLAVSIALRAKAKLIISFNILIDRATTFILNQSIDGELTPELIGMCDKTYQWMEQIDELKDKALSKMSDPDRQILKVIEQSTQKIKTTGGDHSAQMIQDLIDSLANSYKT